MINMIEDAVAEKPLVASATACLKAAGDPLRLHILACLSKDSFGVLELSRLFDCKQSGMSHHLKVLASAGLVTTRREGNSIFYRRNDSKLCSDDEQLRSAIYNLADKLILPKSYEDNLSQIYKQRAELSKDFFIKNAQAFREQQELIAAFDVYSDEVKQLLLDSQCNRKHALEIGPGTGEFLPVLSKYFTHVTALDSSPAMLKQSQALSERQKLSNIHFIENDTAHCHQLTESIDCAVMSMVLHHTPSPGHIFADVAVALKPKGVLIVCELGAHDQDWVREACGDQWLGFTENDLTHWAAQCQLIKYESRYFALRNGFQIQIHQFNKAN